MTVEELAAQGRLREALDALKPSIEQESTPWELRREYHDIDSLYTVMLDFFRRGVEDPGRVQVFTQLTGRTLVLSDKLTLSKRGTDDGTKAFGAPSFWSRGEMAAALVRLRSAEEPPAERQLLVSSITLALLQTFDPRKMEVLCEAAAMDDDAVAIRAVTAIAIHVRRYGRRIPFYPDIEARLRLLGDDTAFLDMLTDVELQFVRSRDTEEIERRMMDDIIPSMLHSPKARGKHIITPDDLTDDGNPEWSQWLRESGLEEKLQELTELQMSGSDVYMATFSKLKNYPFFKETANWFRPFDPSHPAVSHLFSPNEHSIQTLIMRSGMFCNSDKYSFCLSLASIPKAQLDMLQAQFAEQEEAIREELGSDALSSAPLKTPKPSPRTLVRQYIQDLYRFFHLAPERKAYADPFVVGGSQRADDPLHALFHLPGTSLLALFELNFRRHDYASAIDSYEALQRAYPENLDATLWQKYGFCFQKTSNPAAALRAYSMADLLKPDQYWTLHHIAQCQRALGQTDEALESYRRLAAMKPDNLQFIYRQAECLADSGRHEEALPLLYRLAYDDPASLRTARAIVRAQLILQHTEAAIQAAERLLAIPAATLTADDHILIGTAQWLSGQRNEAIHTLVQAQPLPQPGVLHQLGIPQADIPFLLDLVRTAPNNV